MGKDFLLIILFLTYSLSNGEGNSLFQSSIHLTPFGTQFQPKNPIELLVSFSSIRSLIRCSMMCNQNRQCRTFDYDQSSLICRLFEGEVSTGTIITNSTLSQSRIGAIIYNATLIPDLYSSYNQTCDQCTIGNNRYLQCLNNTCQCPEYTYWNGQTCLNQLYNGSNCSSSTLSCRQDLNLTCSNQTHSCIVVQRPSVCNISSLKQPPTLYTAGLGPQSLVSADFNKDNHSDLAITNYNNNSISIFFGIGNGSFRSPAMSFATSGVRPYWLVAYDLNNDSNIDIVLCNEGSATVAILFGLGNGSFRMPATTFSTGGSLPSSIIGADINNDNKIDLVLTNTASGSIATFLGLGNGTFKVLGSSYAAGTSPSSISSGDFNLDGNIDLAVVSRGDNQLRIFFGLGNGSFQSNDTTYTTGSFPYAVRSADFNSDSKQDLVVADFSSNSINVFMGIGNGTFIAASPSTYTTLGAGPIDIAAQDLNGDSIIDLAVSNQVGNSVTVYYGNGNGSFEQGRNYSSAGQKLQSVVSQDFNEDGIYDLAVSNQNDNTMAILLTQCT